MELELKPTTPLRVANKRPFHFIVVGAGGTGGFLIPNLARLVAQTSGDNSHHSITIIDGDEVEDKNIRRQNFITNDVGKNKAEVQAERYANAFGITINAYPNYLEKEDDLKNLLHAAPGFPVILGCVDNNRTRQLIHYVFKISSPYLFWIDAGNEEWSGQVVLGYNYPIPLTRDSRKPIDFYLPPITEVYPDILDDTDAKFNSELSCAERAVSAPQTISANLTASNIMMNMISVMLTSPEDQGLRTHQVKFNAKTNTFTNTLINPENVRIAS